MFPGFYIGDRLIGSYALCAVAGGFVACALAMSLYKKRCRADADMILMILCSVPGAFIGMHLLYGITNIGHFGILAEAEDIGDVAATLGALFGGSVFYGGLLGGIAAAAIYIKKSKMDPGLAADCCAAPFALFHCFGRIGCFLSGCCYGVEWEHGFIYTEALMDSANGVPRFPVQLAEAAFELMLFLLLWRLIHRGKLKGQLFTLYLILYSAGRFILEFLRGDEYRGFLAGFSTSQIISIIIFATCAAILMKHLSRKKSSNTESQTNKEK